MQAYDELKRLVEAAAADLEKAERGNKAAGTRVRKQMQDIKKAAQTVRNTILEGRSATTATGGAVPPPAPPETPPAPPEAPPTV